MRVKTQAAERRQICSPWREPWDQDATSQSSRGAAKQSAEDVPWIIVDAMLNQQLDKLLLKCAFAMVQFLLGDIIRNSGNIRATHAERAITGLPGKGLPGCPGFMYPT